MQACMDRGQVDAVIRVLPGFARDVERGRTTSVQVLLDGTNSNTASIVSGLRRPDHRALFERGDGAAPAAEAGGRHGASAARCIRRCRRSLARSRVWFNPDLQEPELFHPGRDGEHHHSGDAVADRHGHRARKRDRHHGAVDGDADPPVRIDPRQDAAFRAGGILGHAAGAGRGAAGVPRAVSREVSGCCVSRRCCSC